MMTITPPPQELLQLPVVCLSTANFDLTIADVMEGKKTVIDFWTTKCVRCPAALDKLNQLAEEHPDINFVSICCDSLDGAREILDQSSIPRWNAMSHYFMDFEHKETAKAVMGFRQVPFYVIVNEEGHMVHAGNTFDLEACFTPSFVEPTKSKNENEKLSDEYSISPNSPSSVLIIDDLDF